MATPTTDYESGFPDAEYPGNTQQERSLQENALTQRARDYNIHDEEIKALQGYIGAHSTEGWNTGDDTVNDRIISIAGTASCWEGGKVCNYDSIDPSGFMVQKTGQLIDWINPTGLTAVPPIPPVPVGGPPWPGPGGGPVWAPAAPAIIAPANVFNPPNAPWLPLGAGGSNFGPWSAPTDSDTDGSLNWSTTDFLQHLAWRVDTNTLLWQWQSGESINLWPREYTDLPEPITSIIELLNGWPTERTNPSALTPPRASLFDLLMPMAGLLNFIIGALGIAVAVGTVNGSDVEFDVSGIDGGTAGTTVTEIVSVLANSSDSSFDTSNLSDLKQTGGATIVAQGVQGAGSISAVFTGALDTAFGTQVMVFYRKQIWHL